MITNPALLAHMALGVFVLFGGEDGGVFFSS